MLRLEIQKHFDEFINETFKTNTAIRDFILNHERKNICIDNLTMHLKKIELTRPNYVGPGEVRLLAKDYARMFSRAALDHKEEQLLSEAERNRKISEADYFKNLEEQYGPDGTSENSIQIRDVRAPLSKPV